MLWYKAWRESRSRFLLAAAAVTVYSFVVLFTARTSFPPPQAPQLPYSAYVWGEFYGNGRAVVFSVIALVLGLGGLQRERTAATAAFTLSLPVSRGQFVGARVCVGLLELAVVALVPLVVVPMFSPVLVGQTYPWIQSLRYAALFMTWGVVWFAIGFVWSVLFAGEFTAAAAALLSPWVYLIVYSAASQGGQRFQSANPFAMMSGELNREFNGRQLLTPLPWAPMLVLAVVTAALLFGAWRITARHDF